MCLSLFSVISLLIVLNAQLSFYLGTFHKLLTSLSDLSRGRGFDLLNLLRYNSKLLEVVIGTDVLVIRGGELLVMNRSVEPSGQCQKCRVSQTDSVG